MEKFSHYSDKGLPEMVDVSEKNVTFRTAKASGFISLNAETIELIENNLIPKGNPFGIAKIAGIMAAKKNYELIPLCHSLLLTYVDVKIDINKKENRIDIESEIRLNGKTGAEMEALTAVSIAALTIYDMCKAVDKHMTIGDIMLIKKTGGKSDYILKIE